MNELDIFEIERFAIHDGPGIRTTVFFQGCALRCQWCANPESHTAGSHIMFFQRKCVGCGRCAQACPNTAISILEGKSCIDRQKCASCGKCVEACPNTALKISGQKITNEELFAIILRDKDYYEASAGGITISGGEALLQIDKMEIFLQKCRSANINTAVETCGYVPVPNIKKALKYIDLFLVDIKTLNRSKFEKYTGGNIETVFASVEYLCRNAPEKVIARVPVIPGFNDHEIGAIMEYAALHGIKEIHLLPYHTLGITKYEQLGLQYLYPVTQGLDPESLIKYIEIGKNNNMKVKIGG